MKLVHDYDYWLAKVQENGWALESVPEDMMTPVLCLAAVKENDSALQYVPDHLKTLELCLAAVKENGWTLQHVPDHLKTPELCRIADQGQIRTDMHKKFPWGEVVKVHDIAGKYQITEYICGAFEDAGRRQFHTLNCTFDTLEQALLQIVCNHYSPKDWHLFSYAYTLIAGRVDAK